MPQADPIEWMQGVIDEPLTPQDFSMLLQTLVYDGHIELDPEAQDDDDMYRVARLQPPEASTFAQMPCGVCPVCPRLVW